MTEKTPPLVIDVEPEPEVTPKNTCATCKGGKFNKTAPMGECRMLPPQMTIHLVPYIDPISRMQQVRPSAQAGWPPVRRDNWCLAHQPKTPH